MKQIVTRTALLVWHLELRPCRVARRCGPSQGCNPFDLKDTHACVFTPIIQHREPNEGSGPGGWEKLTRGCSRGSALHLQAVRGYGGELITIQGCMYVVHTACPEALHHYTYKPLQSAPQHSHFLLSFSFLGRRARDHLQMSFVGPMRGIPLAKR